MSNLIDHARTELAAAGYKVEPGRPVIEKMVVEDVLELLEVFANQGHSGSSAPMIVALFSKLALFEPLAPITGKPEEWVEVSEGLWQNARCSNVFKDATGAWDIEGIIFEDEDGSRYTSRDSHVRITFPYIPHRQYIRRSSTTQERK
jgi:hypothetical protein